MPELKRQTAPEKQPLRKAGPPTAVKNGWPPVVNYQLQSFGRLGAGTPHKQKPAGIMPFRFNSPQSVPHYVKNLARQIAAFNPFNPPLFVTLQPLLTLAALVTL
jgi:hypothetical protein